MQSSINTDAEIHHLKTQAGFHNSYFLQMPLNLQVNAMASPCFQSINCISSLSLYFSGYQKCSIKVPVRKWLHTVWFLFVCLFVLLPELFYIANHHSPKTSWLILTILIFLHNLFSSSNLYLSSITCILIVDVRQATSRKFHLRTII